MSHTGFETDPGLANVFGFRAAATRLLVDPLLVYLIWATFVLAAEDAPEFPSGFRVIVDVIF